MNGDGRFAAEANYGHRRLGIDRIKQLRAREAVQGAVWHRDHYDYPDGSTEADLPAMNALVWLMRGAAVVGGVYVGEQVTQLLPWVEHVAYFLPVAAATVAAVPAALSVGNAVRAVNIWKRDRQLPKVK